MIEISESLLMSAVSGLLSAGGTWSVVRYRANEAHRAAASAHKRLDEFAKEATVKDKDTSDRVLRVELAQEYLGKNVSGELKHVGEALDEVKAAIDSLRSNGVHCSHCSEAEV